MATKIEQAEKLGSPAVATDRNGNRKGRAGDGHAFVKRSARRAFRRLGKRLLDDAPERYPFKGYEG